MTVYAGVNRALYVRVTSDLSKAHKAHVTRDSIGPAIWAISVQQAIK